MALILIFSYGNIIGTKTHESSQIWFLTFAEAETGLNPKISWSKIISKTFGSKILLSLKKSMD